VGTRCRRGAGRAAGSPRWHARRAARVAPRDGRRRTGPFRFSAPRPVPGPGLPGASPAALPYFGLVLQSGRYARLLGLSTRVIHEMGREVHDCG